MKKNIFGGLAPVNMSPEVSRKLIAYQSGENGYTINYMEARRGASAPPHSHPHLQAVYILSGSGVFLCGGEEIPMESGDILQIGPNVPHTWKEVFEETKWLEFFTPEREDFKPE